MTSTITDTGRTLIRAEIERRLEKKECKECGKIVFALPTERYIVCEDHT